MTGFFKPVFFIFFMKSGDNKMKPGDLLFVSGHSPLDKIIQWLDKGKWNHVAMIVSVDSDGFSILESQYGLNTVIRKCNYDPNDYEVVDIGLSDSQREQVLDLSCEAINHFLDYDYKQILMQGWMDFLGLHGKNQWNSPTHPICSETMVYILHKLNYFIDETHIKNIQDSTPNTLYKLVKQPLTKSA